jgi:hypothetical protein
MKNISVLLSLSLLFVSCEKEIDYQIPNPGDKIVVSADLTHGEIPEVYISTSVYSMLARNPKTNNIYTANLYTDDPNSPFELIPQLQITNGYDSTYVYTSSHIVNEDRSYRLEVSALGLESISATTMIPATRQIENLRFDTISKDLNFSFIDEASQANFYFIELRDAANDFGLIFSSADASLDFFEFGSDLFGDENDGRSYGYEAFFDDSQFQGSRKEVSIRLDELNAGRPFYVYLHSISESYYRFRLTLKARGSSDGFFSEPVQLFSNVEGGYGILAGRSNSRSLVTF